MSPTGATVFVAASSQGVGYAVLMNKVLWVLDTEASGRDFERLCVALLERCGFKSIFPVGGTNDHGRDAELVVDGHVTFFQFSLEAKWRQKLDREQQKVLSLGHRIARFVFVTSRSVTGRTRDQLKAAARATFGWELEILDREWLRHQLEDVHVDLAERYLGVTTGGNARAGQFRLDMRGLPAVARELIANGEAEEAVVVLKRLINDAPAANLWAALASAHYELYHYNDALWAIDRALALAPGQRGYLAIQACVLAESGMATASRMKLLAARDIFATLSEGDLDPTACYNLANVLGALGEHAAARDQYQVALKLNDALPQVWKNLGTAHSNLGEHDEALRCFDRALALEPELSEALVSKGILLGRVQNLYDDAIVLLDRALRNEEAAKRWPDAFWWKAAFLRELQRYPAALQALDMGLRYAPDHQGLAQMKAELLATLWRADKEYAATAEAFFRRRVEVDPSEIASLRELAELAEAAQKSADSLAWLVKVIEVVAQERYSVEDIQVIGGRAPVECLVRWMRVYAGYRGHAPLARCRELDDFSLRPQIDRYSWLTMGVAFSRLAESFLEATDGEIGVRELAAMLDCTRTLVASASADIATLLSRSANQAAQEQQISLMSQIAVALPLLAVYELGAMFGYVSGLRRAPTRAVDRVQCVGSNRMPTSDWMGSVLGVVIERANSELRLFPH